MTEWGSRSAALLEAVVAVERCGAEVTGLRMRRSVAMVLRVEAWRDRPAPPDLSTLFTFAGIPVTVVADAAPREPALWETA